jgi:hypothetical protein
MSTTKYDLLSALIDAQAAESRDEAGWHHILGAVVGIISETHGSEEALADSLFDYIADSVVVKNDDDEGEPPA